MSRRTYILTADAKDMDQISMFCRANHAPGRTASRLKPLIACKNLLKLTCGGQLEGVAGLDLNRGAISGPWVRKGLNFEDFGQRLLVAAERLAVEYGMTNVIAFPTQGETGFFKDRGYLPTTESNAGWHMSRSLIRRTTRFGRVVRAVGEDLGIPADYGVRHKLRLQPEAQQLHSIGRDIFDRIQKMTPPAATAWKQMAGQAAKDNIIIQPVSAFRSLEYQSNLVRKKLEKGQSMERILAVSAAPGYSEHHTGCAIDVTTPGFDVLEEVFENSPAFEWLCNNAGHFNFRLSYPKNNIHGIAYEPWHWCWAS